MAVVVGQEVWVQTQVGVVTPFVGVLVVAVPAAAMVSRAVCVGGMCARRCRHRRGRVAAVMVVVSGEWLVVVAVVLT